VFKKFTTPATASLVVVGSPKAVEAVRALVKVLDVKPEAGATTDFRTFGLKFISANDAASRLRQFFGQVTVADGDTRIPATPVEVIPDFRSNQVTVKGGPAKRISDGCCLRDSKRNQWTVAQRW